MSLVEESISGLRIIKAFNAIRASRRNFRKRKSPLYLIDDTPLP